MYLERETIEALAMQAADDYEQTCDWRRTTVNIIEWLLEDYGFKPRKSLVLLIRKRAQLRWQARSMGVKHALNRT